MLTEWVYNDSEYGWNHRDTFLNPCFNYADVHVAYNNNAFYMVIALINARVSWVVKSNYDRKVVRFEGRVHSGFEPVEVTVNRLIPDPRKVEGCYTCTHGDLIAGVAPEPYSFDDIETIRPKEWVMNSPYVEMSFSFALKDKGLYTVFFWGRDKKRINWAQAL